MATHETSSMKMRQPVAFDAIGAPLAEHLLNKARTGAELLGDLGQGMPALLIDTDDSLA